MTSRSRSSISDFVKSLLQRLLCSVCSVTSTAYQLIRSQHRRVDDRMPDGMHVFYRPSGRAIRKSIRSPAFSRTPGAPLRKPAQILRENTIPAMACCDTTSFSGSNPNMLHTSADRYTISRRRTSRPNSCMTQMLGFGQIGSLRPASFRFLCNRNIRHRPNKLRCCQTHLSQARPRHGHISLSHPASAIDVMVEILSVAGRAIDGLFHGSTIFRMGAWTISSGSGSSLRHIGRFGSFV